MRETVGVMADGNSIWSFALKNNYVILTKDNDFDQRSQVYGCPPKVVHLVCGNKSTIHIANLVVGKKSDLISFGENDTEDCLLKIA